MRRTRVKSAELRKHAGKQMPDYMIPTAFVQMAKLPLTPNGKVDRKALPAPTARDFEARGRVRRPSRCTERKLVQLWEEVLGVSPISVTTNFFDLGGRSLLAARLFTKILRTFGKELPLSILVPLSYGGATCKRIAANRRRLRNIRRWLRSRRTETAAIFLRARRGWEHSVSASIVAGAGSRSAVLWHRARRPRREDVSSD